MPDTRMWNGTAWVSDGAPPANMVTTDTTQTITGLKIFPLATGQTNAAALTTYTDNTQHSGYVTTANGWPASGLMSGFRNGTVGTQRLQSESTGQTMARHWINGSSAWSAWVVYADAQDFDAKGDLLAGTGADAWALRSVGANGTVLTADSAEATGMKWATPAAGGGSTSLASLYKMGVD